MREIDEIFLPLKKSHSGNVQRNVVDVVVLAVSSRSDPFLRRKCGASERCTRTMQRCILLSLVQQEWWRDRLDLQHDGVVLMVESFCDRASPTRSRERERGGGAEVGRWLGLEWGEGCAPSLLI